MLVTGRVISNSFKPGMCVAGPGHDYQVQEESDQGGFTPKANSSKLVSTGACEYLTCDRES